MDDIHNAFFVSDTLIFLVLQYENNPYCYYYWKFYF